MRIGWGTREYERTCQDCGCVWRAPKAAVHPRLRGMPMGNVGGTGAALANSVIAENAALSERAAALGRCPRCESADFHQRSIR